MYSYNLTDEQINNMTPEELTMWKNIIGKNLYSYYGRLHKTYKAILIAMDKARDKYLSKEDTYES